LQEIYKFSTEKSFFRRIMPIKKTPGARRQVPDDGCQMTGAGALALLPNDL
jgi:hypothetical protein